MFLMGRFLVVSFTLLAACSGGVDPATAGDGFLQVDSQAPDFAKAAAGDDAAGPADLAGADLATSPDLAEAPADLSPSCGAAGQACCATRACDAGLDCMRSETDGRIVCIQAITPPGCGSYNQSTCSSGGQAWCGYNTTLGCFLTGSPCKLCAS